MIGVQADLLRLQQRVSEAYSDIGDLQRAGEALKHRISDLEELVSSIRRNDLVAINQKLSNLDTTSKTHEKWIDQMWFALRTTASADGGRSKRFYQIDLCLDALKDLHKYIWYISAVMQRPDTDWSPNSDARLQINQVWVNINTSYSEIQSAISARYRDPVQPGMAP